MEADYSDYLRAFALGKEAIPDWREGDLTEAKLATARAQPAAIQAQTQRDQFEVQKGQAAQQSRADLVADLQRLGARPTAEGVYQIGLRHPEFAQGINDLGKGIGEEQRVATVKRLAPIQSMIAGGHFSEAAAEIDRHRKAAEAAGEPPDEDDDHAYAELMSGDPKRARAVGGAMFTVIAAMNPATAGKTIAAWQQAQVPRGQVVGKGIGHYDESGTWVLDYQAPDYHVLGPQQKLFDTTGGGQGGSSLVAEGAASPDGAGEGAAPNGVRRQNGWTPSATDGGDNPPQIVEAKIGTIGQRLSIDPDKPLSKAQIGPLAEAIAATEGGKGSLADRNNNPTNIRDGSFAKSQSGYVGPGEGGYARFKSPAAGLLAAKGLLSRYYARGQRTIRDIIAGKPMGEGRTQSQGGARLVAEGGPAPSYQMLSPAQASARGLDPSRSYQVAPNGRVTPVGGTRGGSGKAGGPPRTVTSVVAPILQKVAAGQALTPGETEALRYYRSKGGKGGAAPATGGEGKPTPKVGTVMDGHRFIGGDASKASNWVAVK